MVIPHRIGLDARPLSTRMSGVGRLIGEILKSFPNPEAYTFYLYSHLPIHPDHKDILSLPNVVVPKGGGIFRWKGGLYYNLYLPILLRFQAIDLFWGSQQILPPFLPRRIKAFLTYCDLVLYFFPKTMRGLARFQMKLFQRYSVRRSSYILSISQQTSGDVCKFFGYPKELSGVTYPGLNKDQIQTALSQSCQKRYSEIGEGFILSVSTIEPRKNYPFLLEVYRAYRKLNPKQHREWIIIGKIGWEDKEFIQELKTEQSLFRDIHILDSVDDIALHHLYRNCGLFLFASKYEGFGIPLLEALYHNKYAIVSDIPTFREIGGDSITYLPIHHESAIALWVEAIKSFFETPKIPNADIEKFKWENAANKTEEVIAKLLLE
ncbi:glycosyltransferase [Leptospira ryugenii]|uniref:Glycosyltransferase n=1 Tax=Leptospira ryugenii TaxID=1917863 RepID=A0A2P2DWM1_9LEPT|nr:glycosyltransferase family 1 protein [Leptospira ryugenii]GBF49034.1 glycosyltransferase [Leptospira ryugenii]